MPRVGELFAEVWRRATTDQPPPAPGLVLAAAAVAVLLVLHPTLWRVSRVLVTITHEGGHAVAAVLAGRRLQGIRVHSDTSGLTVSRGRPSGPGASTRRRRTPSGPSTPRARRGCCSRGR